MRISDWSSDVCSSDLTGWLAKLHQAVDSGLTAEAAVQRVQCDTRHRMQAITDPYLRERLADLDNLANRLLLHLAGTPYQSAAVNLPDNALLLAPAMGDLNITRLNLSQDSASRMTASA